MVPVVSVVPVVPAPAAYRVWDIKEKPVLVDSQRLLHQTKEPVEGGYRLVCSLFNKDLSNNSKEEFDDRSVKLIQKVAEQGQVETRYLVGVDNTSDDFKQTLHTLLFNLEGVTWSKDRSSNGRSNPKYGGRQAKYIKFGCSQGRCRGGEARKKYSPQTEKATSAYRAFVAFMDVFCPGIFSVDDEEAQFNIAYLALESPVVWHRDKGNVGPAVLFTLGTFTSGGELMVEDPA